MLRFSPVPFRSVVLSVVLAGIAALLFFGQILCAAGRVGPVLPGTASANTAENTAVNISEETTETDVPESDSELNSESAENIMPLPPPKRNPLLERPKTASHNRRAVFDRIDPVAIVPQNFLDDNDLDDNDTVPAADSEPEPTVSAVRAKRLGIRQRQTIPQTMSQTMPQTMSQTMPQTMSQTMPQTIPPMVSPAFPPETGQAGVLPETVLESAGTAVMPAGEFSFDDLPADMNGYAACPMVQTFGMGICDNLTLFSEMTAFKTELNNGAGSFGIGEGFNWSTPFTPQGTITAQYGIRGVQSDNFSRSARSQCFMTAGLFKRFEFIPLQGGAAFDWLHDHSSFGSVNLQQLRCELSLRTFRNLEYGFIGGFDVFQTRPTTPKISQLAIDRFGSPDGALAVNDYYLLFIRKQLDSGGQAEFRLGATARGDMIFGGQGEAALTDRIAINGSFCLTAPSEGHTADGNLRERWSMSLGVVIYFRGGAACRSVNLYRPMFDVAGNNSFFNRLIGR